MDVCADATNHRIMKERQAQKAKLVSDLENGVDVRTEKRFYIQIPRLSSHNHPIDHITSYTQNVHPKIIEKIGELVSEGVTDKHIIRTQLNLFVRQVLCVDSVRLPSKDQRCYYPSDKDIENSVLSAKLRMKYSAKDQDELERKIHDWLAEDPEASFFLRKYAVSDQASKETEKFLFVSQEKWQKDLLNKYGQTMFLLDATYKVCKYSLPLFFLCVKTNVDYVVVGQFICQYEDTESIIEGLRKIAEWNPTWKPTGGMCDFSEAEINALETAFPGLFALICDFHREQAWERWVKKGEHGVVHEDREPLLTLLRKVAHATTKEELDNNRSLIY